MLKRAVCSFCSILTLFLALFLAIFLAGNPGLYYFITFLKKAVHNLSNIKKGPVRSESALLSVLKRPEATGLLYSLGNNCSKVVQND